MMENVAGKLEMLLVVIGPVPEDVEDAGVETPSIVDIPETPTLPPPFKPLEAPASFENEAGALGEVFGKLSAVMVTRSPSVEFPKGKLEVIPRLREVESEIAFAAESTPKVTVPPTVKLGVVSVEPPLGRLSVPFELRLPKSKLSAEPMLPVELNS
jgi:hypothetical protein